MNQKVLSVLEFHKITEQLALHATSDPGRKMCHELMPYEYLSDALRALDETGDAMERIMKRGSISFGSNKNMEACLRVLGIGGSLDMKALLDAASFLENVSRVKRYGAVNDDTLTEYFLALEPLTGVADEIRRCILSEDEMAPDASPALRSIRRQIGQCSDKIRDVLNKMVNGAARSYLQDPVITMRGDRFCLPVKLEYKSQVGGIVHDRSSSGSTLFIEPSSVVDLNNKLKELELQELKEIERILAELSAMLADHHLALKENATYMTLLDFVFAKAAYALEINAMKPSFSDDRSFNLIRARHPLIAKDKVVPIRVYLGSEAAETSETQEAGHDANQKQGFRMLVVTGPNTGGKTVTLKTTGLLTLMGEAGLCIPAADGSKLAFFREIYADIGDEQSIEQSLSTFSSHMTNIVQILRDARETDLCLFDELGAGTDPTEGAALAISILNNLLLRGVSVMATTHYAELKVFAMTTPSVKNASCEFDVETLRPTYRLLIGTPGASNAFAISQKLGIPDEIIEGAHGQMDTDKKKLESLFSDLERSRKSLELAREESARLKEETVRLNKELEKQAGELDELGEDILDEARENAEKILAEAKEFADETIRLMRKAGAGEELLSEAERKRTALNERLSGVRKENTKRQEQKNKNKETSQNVAKTAELIPGTTVRILSMGLKGTVQGTPDKDGKLTVMCGVMQVETNVRDVAVALEDTESGEQIEKRFSMKRAFEGAAVGGSAGKHPGSAKSGAGGFRLNEGVSHELNLIGMNTDDALAELDKYLDDALRAHLSTVRIVHGKGSGILRAAVGKYLRGVKSVKSFQAGEYGEGDSGVTVVKFK